MPALSLNQQYSIHTPEQRLEIKAGKGGIPVIDIQNRQACAQISLQGAQLLQWKPQSEDEVIWLSEQAEFSTGKALRGGIPVCWPWFGAHPEHSSYPSHGFARTTLWQLEATEALASGATRIDLSLPPNSAAEYGWPDTTTLTLSLIIGNKLEMALTTRNHGRQPVVITQALHSYFKVGNIDQVVIRGLEDTDYLDKLEQFQRKHQHDPIRIDREIDRIYLDTTRDCIIEDASLQRKIIIKKSGSRSTVLWNPWRETARKMGDLGERGYQNMVCVESANAAEDSVTIEPSAAHRLWVEYEVEPLLER